MTELNPEIAELRSLFYDSWCDPMHREFNPNDPRWQEMPSDVRMAFLHARQRLAVLERGWTCIGVFPTDEGGHHFAYTVGLDPAIIVVGISQSAQPVLELAVQLADELNDGQVHEVGDDKLVFAPVPDDEFRSHATMAVNQGATRARQFIWTDDQGRWPWDPGHRHQTEGTLPVLAGSDWRANGA